MALTYFTLVVYLTVPGPSINIDGFSNVDDCAFAGQLNLDYVQLIVDTNRNLVKNPQAQFRCDKTGRPPVVCLRDTRTYGRTGECITERR